MDYTDNLLDAMIERRGILGNIERSMNNKKPIADAKTASLLNV